MTINKELKVPVSRSERTDEIVIQTPRSGAYVARILRVTRDYFADGSAVEVSRRWLQRGIGQLIADLHAAPLVGLLPPILDCWALADDAAVAQATEVAALAALEVANTALAADPVNESLIAAATAAASAATAATTASDAADAALTAALALIP